MHHLHTAWLPLGAYKPAPLSNKNTPEDSLGLVILRCVVHAFPPIDQLAATVLREEGGREVNLRSVVSEGGEDRIGGFNVGRQI